MSWMNWMQLFIGMLVIVRGQWDFFHISRLCINSMLWWRIHRRVITQVALWYYTITLITWRILTVMSFTTIKLFVCWITINTEWNLMGSKENSILTFVANNIRVKEINIIGLWMEYKYSHSLPYQLHNDITLAIFHSTCTKLNWTELNWTVEGMFICLASSIAESVSRLPLFGHELLLLFVNKSHILCTLHAAYDLVRLSDNKLFRWLSLFSGIKISHLMQCLHFYYHINSSIRCFLFATAASHCCFRSNLIHQDNSKKYSASN